MHAPAQGGGVTLIVVAEYEPRTDVWEMIIPRSVVLVLVSGNQPLKCSWSRKSLYVVRPVCEMYQFTLTHILKT